MPVEMSDCTNRSTSSDQDMALNCRALDQPGKLMTKSLPPCALSRSRMVVGWPREHALTTELARMRTSGIGWFSSITDFLTDMVARTCEFMRNPANARPADTDSLGCFFPIVAIEARKR